jgi:hypothetical protein
VPLAAAHRVPQLKDTTGSTVSTMNASPPFKPQNPTHTNFTVPAQTAAVCIARGQKTKTASASIPNTPNIAAVINGLRALIKQPSAGVGASRPRRDRREVVWLMRSDTSMRDMSLSHKLFPDLPSVRGDRVQLQQVVLNLVLIGLEAVREPHAGARSLVIRTARDGATVQDSGQAIVRTIVTARGGAVEAESHPEVGASLCFTGPVDPEGAR